MKFPVYANRCDQCLFSKDKIVSDTRRKDLLEDMAKKGSWFVCHKASIAGESVCCKGFYDTKSNNDLVIAERLGMIEFVPLPNAPAVGAKGKPMALPPEGYTVVHDVNERLQEGDMTFDREDEEWYPVSRKQLSSYTSQHAGVCRPVPKTAAKRIMRSRRPTQDKKA